MAISMTVILVIATSIISYQCFQRPYLKQFWAHHPYSVKNRREYYRLISSGFVHGSWTHLLINMFVLWMFGEHIERYFTQIWEPWIGRLLFVGVYLLTIILANIPSQFSRQDQIGYFSLGASGGVSGIVFIFILFHPWEKLYLYFVLPIYAIVGGALYLIYSHWASRNSRDNIDHSAHFWGALWGVALTIILEPQLVNLFWSRFIEGFPL